VHSNEAFLLSVQGEGSDLTAFNKLISLMQAGEARPVESPSADTSRNHKPVDSPSSDMNKFNKLIALMQQGAVKPVESPKNMMVNIRILFFLCHLF